LALSDIQIAVVSGGVPCVLSPHVVIYHFQTSPSLDGEFQKWKHPTKYGCKKLTNGAQPRSALIGLLRETCSQKPSACGSTLLRSTRRCLSCLSPWMPDAWAKYSPSSLAMMRASLIRLTLTPFSVGSSLLTTNFVHAVLTFCLRCHDFQE
jgi:CRISPR-associated Cas5-like protein